MTWCCGAAILSARCSEATVAAGTSPTRRRERSFCSRSLTCRIPLASSRFIASPRRAARSGCRYMDGSCLCASSAGDFPVRGAHLEGRNTDADAPADMPFEKLAEEVFERNSRRWKPRTLAVNRIYLRRQILSFFEGRPVAGITQRDVQA